MGFIERRSRIIGLGQIGDGSDSAGRRAVLGNIAEEIDVPCQVIPFRRHGIHNVYRGQGILVGLMGIADLIGQSISLDGAAELVGIAAAVPVDGEQIQLVLALQAHGVTAGSQHMEQEAQIEVGIVGNEQGVARQQSGDLTAGRIPGNAVLLKVFGGDAGELLDFRRHPMPRLQLDQGIVFSRDGGFAGNSLHGDGRKLNDLIRLEPKSGGLRIEDQEPVVGIKQGQQMLHRQSLAFFANSFDYGTSIAYCGENCNRFPQFPVCRFRGGGIFPCKSRQKWNICFDKSHRSPYNIIWNLTQSSVSPNPNTS